MIQPVHATENINLTTPHGLHDPDHEGFLMFPSSQAMFRVQRLAIYLASSLFTPGYMTASNFVKDNPLVTLTQGKHLLFTGEIFDQWDLDVLIHCAKQTSLAQGNTGQIQLEPAPLLRSLNLRNSKRNQERVFASLHRLHTGTIEIAGKGYRYMTRLINRVLLDEEHRQCIVEVNGDVTAALRRGDTTSIKARERLSLGRNGLAKWLHGATMVFRGGFGADVSSLHTLCGAPAKSLPGFSSRLCKALDVLAQAGFLETWKLEGDHVRVTARPVRAHHSVCGVIYPKLLG
jgi:hypothetical protein